MQYKEGPSLWKILSIKSTNLSLIRLWGKVVYNVEKSYVDSLFNLINLVYLIDQNRLFTGPFIDFFTIFVNMIFYSSKTRG